MHREVLPGFTWIQECGPPRHDLVAVVPNDWHEQGRACHLPQNAYLLAGEKTLLFDTLSPAGRRQIVADVEAALGGRPLDYLVVSHPDVPHAGNTAQLLRRWPEATLVAPRYGRTHALYHLEGAELVGPGDGLDLGGFRVRFHEATFLDHGMHVWMTEETTGTLFPVDWLGFPHMEGTECLRLADEIEAPVSVQRLVEFHGRVLFWYQYADVERVVEAGRRVLETHRPRMLAPAHGLVVRDDIGGLFRRMEDVVAYVAAHGRTGVA